MEMSAKSKQLLGTRVEIQLPREHASLFSECFSEMGRVEKAYSRFLPGSDLSRLNSHLGQWQEAPGEFLFLLSKAEEFWKKTGGNFDITMKAALDGLGYDAAYSFVPKPKAAP
ncbi:MAG: FAD:protein FMN transferase, partial [Candidatus Micrarchaeia archaeon]